jgi:uncharacterized protein (TIGR00156 family)
MKRNRLVFIVLAVFIAGLMAGCEELKDPVSVTVSQAKNQRDGTQVKLQGSITQFLGDEKYVFEDDTGTIVVEIDANVWYNGLQLAVTELPEGKVEVTGEVEKDRDEEAMIDVRSIKRL